jgi:RNase H-like domain found in reverse transcriptase
VLQLLQTNGLVINADKCLFGHTSLEFLGHLVQADGIRPLPDRVVAVKNFPRPTTMVEMQAFLGLYNYFCASCRTASQAADRCVTGRFEAAVQASVVSSHAGCLQRCQSRHLGRHAAGSSVAGGGLGASGSHVGAVLQQRKGQGSWQPLGFFSQKLIPTESRYSAFDRELLAVYSSILNFRHLLEGRQFTVFLDHKPLSGALTRVLDPRSDRQRQQLAFITEFVSEIHHIAGWRNVVADTLSRPPPISCSSPSSSTPSCSPPSSSSPSCSPPSCSATSLSTTAGPAAAAVQCQSPPIDLIELAAAQESCPDCVRAVSSPVLKVKQVEREGCQLWVDTSSGVMRPLVPLRRVFDCIHSLAHPGIRATRRLIASRYL